MNLKKLALVMLVGALLLSAADIGIDAISLNLGNNGPGFTTNPAYAESFTWWHSWGNWGYWWNSWEEWANWWNENEYDYDYSHDYNYWDNYYRRPGPYHNYGYKIIHLTGVILKEVTAEDPIDTNGILTDRITADNLTMMNTQEGGLKPMITGAIDKKEIESLNLMFRKVGRQLGFPSQRSFTVWRSS